MKLESNWKEWLIIVVAWIVIFALEPLYVYYIHQTYDFEFSWIRVFSSWIHTAAFFILFIIHHFLLVPYIYKKRYKTYGIALTITLAIFIMFFTLCRHPFMPDPKDIHKKVAPTEMHVPTEMPIPAKAPMPQHVKQKHEPYDGPLAPPDMARILISVLIICVDLGIVAGLNEQKLRRHMLLMERQHLQQELQQLHYQINPHFFMNTLNNIHALVDLDQERAKRAIVELSQLMRYALYENNSLMVSLNHEIEFLNLYVSLMRLRFTDKVEIQCVLPTDAHEGLKIPPLLLATFVENAFKHGVSCLAYSFIHIHLWIDEEESTIKFRCSNSRHGMSSSNKDESHGIGLENVRKRLDIQYADKYRLVINDNIEDIFNVDLTLPKINS